MATNDKKNYNIRTRKPDLNTLVYGKVPPQAPYLEEAVIGACLLEKDTFDQVMQVLPSDECFYMEAHQKIFRAMRDTYDKGIDVDLLTITEALRKANDLELIGGAYYLTKLTQTVVSSAHAITHARIVMEKFIQRELIRISGAIIGDAYEDSTDVFDLLDKSETELYQISQRMLKKDYSAIQKIVREVINEDDDLMNMPEGLVGISTGNRELDSITGGFKEGKMIIFAARPSVGKTAFALNIVHHVGVVKKVPVGFFSLEMQNGELLRRLISIDTKINTYIVDYPKSRNEFEKRDIAASYQKFANTKIYFDDTAALSIVELRAKARRMVNKHKVRIIFIDYLQLMQGDSEKSFNREAEISKISREIKKLAKELKIPIVALCQLNRDIEKRSDGKFRLSDLRESGGIEQDGDLIGFLWRPDEEDIKKDPTVDGLGKLVIAKHRGGKKGTVLYSADMSTQTWGDYDETHQPITGIRSTGPGPTQPGNWKKLDENYKPPTNNYNPSPETIDDLPF